MKKLLLLSSIIVHCGLLSMDEKIEPEKEVELKEVKIDTMLPYDQYDQKLNVLLAKITDLEKSQKNQRNCTSKLLMTVSAIGSISSTIGLLLYLASWYVEF